MPATFEGLVFCVICGNKTLPSKCSENNIQSVETLNKFMNQLGIPAHESSSEVRFCDECFSGVVKAVGWGEEVREVERDVRSLQRIILKMMRQLQTLQGSYLEEMRALEQKIRKLKVGKPRESWTDEISSCSIKQGIIDVVMDLGNFQQNHSCSEANAAPSHENVPTTEFHANALQFPAEEIDPDGVVQAILFQMKENAAQDHDVPTTSENVNREYATCSENLTKQESGLVEQEYGTHSNNGNSSSNTVVMSSLSKIKRKKPRASEVRSVSSEPSQCCGKTFTSNRALKRHMITHTGERSHKCPKCSMAFWTNSNLNRHLMIHSGKKPFICPQCETEFYRKDSLERHKKTHSNRKRFSCPVCGQRYKDRRCMKDHLTKKHTNYAVVG